MFGTWSPTQVSPFKRSFLRIQTCGFLQKLLRDVQELGTAVGRRLADREESAFAFYAPRVPSAAPETAPQTKKEIGEELRQAVSVTKLALVLRIPSTGGALDFPGSAKCLKYNSVEKKLADISTFGLSAGAWLWNLLLSVIKQTSGTLKESFFSVCRWKRASCSFTSDHSQTPTGERCSQSALRSRGGIRLKVCW